MKFSLSLFALAGVVSTVAADAASITAALQAVGNSAQSVGAKLSAWKGDIFGVAPVVAGAADLVITLQVSTVKIRQSEKLSEDDALNVALATGDLIAKTLPTLDALVAARPKFDKLLLRPVLYLGLLSQRKEIADLGEAAMSKLPAAYVEMAKALLLELNAAFDAVIAQYKP